MEIFPKPKDRSLKRLVEDLRIDAGLLVRQEIALVKAEVKQAALFAGAGLLAYTGLLVLFAALVLGLVAIGVVAWLAALAVGAVVLVGAFFLLQRARHGDKAQRE